jgi:DNA helicase-2/ATP-dependent DNA helicase PcrA
LSPNQLNGAQQQAVHVNGHCMITAPPGSGKTKVLEHRAEFILTSPAHSVVGVTFTAAAAAELEQRIRKLVPGAGKRVYCGTFHSLCKRQLQASGIRFVLVNEVQQQDLMRRAYVDILGRPGEVQEVSFEEACIFIDWVKSSIEPLVGRSERELLLQEVLDRYQELLHQMGGMDFSDLLSRAVKGMKAGTVKPLPVTHLLVDECQDSDDVQYAWIREHIRVGAIVSIVGDDDQCIFSFRSAAGFRGMEGFRQETSAAHVALLTTYRCANEIITPASRLISLNATRVQKAIRTANHGVGSVMVRHAESPESELLMIADAIRQSGAPQDWGILARNNDLLDGLERILTLADVPYLRLGGMSFWDVKGPSLFLAVCGSLGGDNLIGVDNLLRKCGVGEDLLRRMHLSCHSKHPGSLGRFMNGPAMEGDIGRFQRRIREWHGLLKSGKDRLALYGIAEFIKKNARIYESERSSKLVMKDHQRLDDCARSLSCLKGSLGSRLALLKINESRSPTDDVTRVMTMHASKGLEFRNVWIFGCEQGIVPSSKSTDIEEERRLFYVGMTRAKERLFLSYPLREKGQRSIFLGEAGL